MVFLRFVLLAPQNRPARFRARPARPGAGCSAGSRSARCRGAGRRPSSAASAILDASGTRVNIDSPNTARPIATQYRPPARRPSIQASTLCANPARWNASYARDHLRHDPGARSGPAAGCAEQARMTSSKALSMRNSKRGSAMKRAKRLAQRAVQLELAGEQHHARVGAPPQDGLALAEPGKDAAMNRRGAGCRCPARRPPPAARARAGTHPRPAKGRETDRRGRARAGSSGPIVAQRLSSAGGARVKFSGRSR